MSTIRVPGNVQIGKKPPPRKRLTDGVGLHVCKPRLEASSLLKAMQMEDVPILQAGKGVGSGSKEKNFGI